MKMADGGFRPAYNCQISTAAAGQIVIAVDVDTTGSDRGLVRPMLSELQRCYGRRPNRHLVDGGFNKNDDTEWAASIGVDIDRGRHLWSASEQQAQDRLLCTASRRWPRCCGLAQAHGQPAGQGNLQTALHARVHQCPLSTMASEPVHRSRTAQGHDGAAVVRAGSQHPCRKPPNQCSRIKMLQERPPQASRQAILTPMHRRLINIPLHDLTSCLKNRNRVTSSQDDGGMRGELAFAGTTLVC